MKRPLQLPLAIALALGGTNALALGLGPVHVKSRLNEPLNAEIPVLQGSAGEAEGLLVGLAAAEDFERVGINRAHLNVPLEFSVIKGANGEPVIKVTSAEPVRSTYLDFLLEANWPKGRLLREYTVLLDPPVTAPVRSAVAEATPAPASARESATTQPLREPRSAPAAVAAPRPAAKPAPAAPAPKTAGADEYGPVAAGETLSVVARAARPGVNVNQTMLALFKHNPNAFYKDNINALKRGAILRVPSADEIKAVSVADAAAQVQAQVEDWRGGRASPTRVADTGADQPAAASPAKAPKSGAANSRDGGERLALVPPKAGRDSIAMADRPGAGAGSPAASGELKSELARTKEALASKDHETGELKSRVKELEDLKGKNDRLLSLKDSEIAELQQKLRELQAKSATTPAAPAKTPAVAEPAAAPVAATATPKADAKIDKHDIWGDAGAAAAAPKATEVKPGESKPAEPKPEAKPAEAMAEAKPVDDKTAEAKPGDGAPPSAAAPAPAVATTTPLPATPATSATPAPSKPSAKPAAAAPAEAWYEAPWVLPGALGGGVLLLALGALGLRKRKQAKPVRESIATAFGDSPLGAAADGSFVAEEAKLREQLRDDPSNIGLYLELLSLCYAERDVARFEDTAREMHAHVVDPYQPEWLEAQAMGQELAPHNPLFAGSAARDDEADGIDPYAETAQRPAFESSEDLDWAQPDAPVAADEITFGFDAPGAPEPVAAEVAFEVDEAAFGFGTQAAPAAVPAATDALDEPFSFDDLPPLEFDIPVAAAAVVAPDVPDLPDVVAPVHVPAPPVAPAARDDDIFAGEDAVATKLDLARAYMDMGDPEGARSMLEEVLVEGSDTQKGEAQRLMAELR